MVTASELEQPGHTGRRVEQPLLRISTAALAYRLALTFTLLSPLELINNGCPCTHSSPPIACSCARFCTWMRRPPLLRSQIPIDPAVEEVARTGGPSALSVVHSTIDQDGPLTHSKAHRGYRSIVHLDLHDQLALPDVENSNNTVLISYSDNVNGGRLCQGCDS